MAFVWIEDILVDAEITKAATEEIRSNIDQVVDNLANVAHDSGDYANHRSPVDNTDKIGVDDTDKVGVDGGYNSTYQDGYKSGVKSTDYGTHLAGDKTTEYSGQNGTYRTGEEAVVT